MAKGSILILKDKIDVNKLIEQLNMALSEEWLAYYQYWIGSFLILVKYPSYLCGLKLLRWRIYLLLLLFKILQKT